MDWRLAFVALALASGCVSSAAPAALAPLGSGGADDAGGFRFGEPVLLGVVQRAAEPHLALGPGERVYVASHVGPYLWRSGDGGRSFEALGAPCELPVLLCLEGGARELEGAGDASLVALPDGTLAWLGLGSTPDIPFQRSFDEGETWTRARDLESHVPFASVDRQWLTATPEGTLFAQWRRLQGGEGVVLVRRSDDGGATWGAAVVAAPDGQTGETAVDPASGALYLPVFDFRHTGRLHVAASHDGGATWSRAAVPMTPAPFLAFWPTAAVDDAGTAYVAWAANPSPLLTGDPVGASLLLNAATGVPAVFLSASRDGGATWSAPVQVSAPGKPAVFPWMVAGAAGRVAVAFYEGDLGLPGSRLPERWHMTLATSFDADAASPAFERHRVVEAPVRVGPMCQEGSFCGQSGGDRTSGEVMTMRLREDGLPTLAFTRDASLRAATVEVVVVRVEDGPRLR